MINSPAAYRDIFNSKANVKKTKFYEVWAKDEDSFNSLTVIDKAVHARKRRTLNSVFSEKSLRSSEAFLLKHIDRWHKLTLDGDGKDWGEARNMAVWIECLIFDILGDLCFGKSFDIKEPEDNPLKTIPDSINNYMALFNPVGAFFVCKWILLTASDCPIPIIESFSLGEISRSPKTSRSNYAEGYHRLRELC